MSCDKYPAKHGYRNPVPDLPPLLEMVTDGHGESHCGVLAEVSDLQMFVAMIISQV